MTETVHAAGAPPPTPGVRTFLIADVRGYTRFTVEHGDEAAAKLAARFAAIARETVSAYQGEVIELRGDEALAVFSSARQALRAAVELQGRCTHETMADTTLPLTIGIGLDAGEAIPLEGGYRGAALNLAARLCSLAGPGEVLASDGVVHLARKVEGVEYAERGVVQLKGFADPVRAIEVLVETEADQPRPAAERHPGTYRVQLLGPFALVRDEQPLDSRRWQRRVGSLFRLLAITPGKHRLREEVIELLWPDASPEAGAGNLRLLAYRLRQALGNPDPPPIVAEGDWITLNLAYHWEVDLDRFEELATRAGDDLATLEEVASLVQGEPLPEDRYEDWAAPARERVQRQWRETCLRLAGLHASRGAHQDAARWYERVLQDDPLNEEAVQGLLAILVKEGRRTEALRRYRQLEQRLETELGVPPEPETLALVAQIEERMTRLANRPEPLADEEQRALVPILPTYPLLRTEPLVGRDAELGELVAALPARESHVAAPVRLMLVAAEAGIGKTRLLAEVAERAREVGLLTLAGGSYEQEGGLPYGPIHDALLDYVRTQPEERLRSQLDGLLPELARVLPELRTHLPDLGESPSEDPENQRLRLFSTLAQVLKRIAQDEPLVLLLDDLHWADDATLQLLHFLIRQDDLSRVLMVGAYRKEEVAPETLLAQLEARAPGAAWAKLLTLTPLDEEGLTSLLNERLDGRCTEDLVKSLYQRSGGNPFFALQMLQLLKQEGHLVEAAGVWRLNANATVELSPEVRETVARRLRRVAPDEREVLTLGAVLGREFGYVPLEALWEGNERSLFTALDASLDGYVLTEIEEGYAFSHPLLWEVVHDRIASRRRMRLHQKAGRKLETLYGERAEEHAAELVRHFREGGDSHRALRYALLAGEHAEDLTAGSEAMQYYRIAVELARELGNQRQLARSLFKLGVARRLAGSLNEALPLFEEATELYRALSDPVSEALSLAFVASVQVGRERVEETDQPLKRIEHLLDSIGNSDPSLELAHLYQRLGVVHTDMGRYSQALIAVSREAEIARALGNERLLIQAELSHYELRWFLGQVHDLLDEVESLLRRAESLGNSLTMRDALAHAAEAATYAGRFEQGWEYRQRELAVEERIPSPFLMVSTLSNLAWQARLRGEWEVAREYIQRSLDVLSSISNVRSPWLPMLQRGTLALWAGDWELASRSLEESAATAERLGQLETLRLGQAALAELHLLQGRPEAAARRLEPVLDRPGLQEFDVTTLLPILAWAHLEMSDVGRAEQLVAEGIQRALAQGNRLALVDGLRVQGMVLTRLGRWEEAEHAFGEAVSLARSMPYPYAEARALYEWGMMHARKGGPKGGQAQLEKALAIFRRLGAIKDVERTEQALGAG